MVSNNEICQYGTHRTFQLAAVTLGFGNGRFDIILACMRELGTIRQSLVPVRDFQRQELLTLNVIVSCLTPSSVCIIEQYY